MEPTRRPASTPWSQETESGVSATPPGWEDYRAARERFLRTLQIDSLNRLLSRPEAEPGPFRPDGAR